MLRKVINFIVIPILFIFCLVMLSKCVLFYKNRVVAITMDDLPLLCFDVTTANNHIEHIVNTLQRHKAPMIGFVIANRAGSDRVKQLELLRQHGFVIGNHTYSHLNLNYSSADEYIRNIEKADQILFSNHTGLKYFRYPYLAEGKWWRSRNAVHAYLEKKHYKIIPVTIDSRDFLFNLKFKALGFNPQHPDFAQLKKDYLHYIWQETLKAERHDKWFSWLYHSRKQLLLLHANELNSYVLDSILSQYENHGYHFITIHEAMES